MVRQLGPAEEKQNCAAGTNRIGSFLHRSIPILPVAAEFPYLDEPEESPRRCFFYLLDQSHR